MKIAKLILENIRCFKHAEINFGSAQEPSDWTVLLGDNGVGKTTIMRSLAMGLVDKTSSSALLRELYGDWIRRQASKKKPAYIHIFFDKEDEFGLPWHIKTSFEDVNDGDTKVRQETNPEGFPWEDIFLCGYGAARRAYGSKDYAEYSPIDAVYTLFNYDAPLQNPELILRRLKDAGLRLKEIFNWIEEILMLPKESVELTFKGITVSGPWGKFMPLGSIGDGHQATLAWLLDMLGWAMFYDKKLLKKNKNEISGIVLLDEIEHHLHPIWQKRILSLIYEQFPNIQFITTTHSVLAATGTTSLPNKKCSLVLLEQEDDHSIIHDRLSPPYMKRADQVLTSYLFGLESTRNDVVQHIERYSKLLSKSKLAKEEENELKNIRIQLKEEIGSAETELQRLVEKAVRDTLDKLVAEISKNQRPPKEALDFEMRRQLNELFGKEELDDKG